MNHVTCRIVPNIGLILQRDPGVIIGEVREVNGEPTIHLYRNPTTSEKMFFTPTGDECKDAVLTFMDIKIIQDNWNEFSEKKQERLKTPGVCPECGMLQGHYPFCQQS